MIMPLRLDLGKRNIDPVHNAFGEYSSLVEKKSSGGIFSLPLFFSKIFSAKFVIRCIRIFPFTVLHIRFALLQKPCKL